MAEHLTGISSSFFQLNFRPYARPARAKHCMCSSACPSSMATINASSAWSTRSVKHAPVDTKSGKPICWDAACYIGRNRPGCPNAPEPLPALGKLDPTVATQVLRRGGLWGEKKINPKEVDGRVAQFRAQIKEDQSSKQADGKFGKPGKPKGKAKASGKAKAGWQIPEDYSGPMTAMENELGRRAGTGPFVALGLQTRPNGGFHPCP